MPMMKLSPMGIHLDGFGFDLSERVTGQESVDYDLATAALHEQPGLDR
jgi:hypothetical protein